jgi:hypothetical protein
MTDLDSDSEVEGGMVKTRSSKTSVLILNTTLVCDDTWEEKKVVESKTGDSVSVCEFEYLKR